MCLSNEETFDKRPGRKEGRNHIHIQRRHFFRQKKQGVHLGEGLVCLKNSKKRGQCACYSERRCRVRKLHEVALMPSQDSNV